MTPSVRRLVVGLGLGALALVAGWGATEAAYWPARLTVSAATNEAKALAAVRTKVSGLRAELARLSVPSSDERLDSLGTAEEALQRLQERIREAVQSSGGVLSLSAPSMERLAPRLAALRVTVRAQLGETELLDMLARLESTRPAVAVTALEIASPGNGTGRLEVFLSLVSVHVDAT